MIFVFNQQTKQLKQPCLKIDMGSDYDAKLILSRKSLKEPIRYCFGLILRRQG
jgi:hypothetical protein